MRRVICPIPQVGQAIAWACLIGYGNLVAQTRLRRFFLFGGRTLLQNFPYHRSLVERGEMLCDQFEKPGPEIIPLGQAPAC